MEAPLASMAQPYPPLPASPTLTNPDMILPDYDRASSPDLDEDRSQSPLLMWKNAHAAASGPDLEQLYTTPSSSSASQPHAFPAGPRAPITPTTPIIYGNGTMLSDIGEVTEVESTPGRPSPSSRRRTSPASSVATANHHQHHLNHHHALKDRESLVDAALRSSPTMGLEGAASSSSIKKRAKKQQHQQQQQQHQQQKQHASQDDRLRRASMESNSTITTQDQAALFADFDDTVSVGDSVFQGDDEESVADSYVDDDRSPVREMNGAPAAAPPADTALAVSAAAVSSSSRLTVPSSSEANGGGSSGNVSSNDDRQSTTSLGQRAEQILANAKRRLTVCRNRGSECGQENFTLADENSPFFLPLDHGG